MDSNTPPNGYRELVIKLSRKVVDEFRLYNIIPKRDKTQEQQSKLEHKVNGSKNNRNNSEQKSLQICDDDVYGM